jgi:transcriptional regulator GlxA family with amidase domain
VEEEMGPSGMKLSLRSYGEALVTHTHDFDQIVLPVVGRLENRVGGTTGILSPDRLAVIGRGTAHSFRAYDANRFVVLDVRQPMAATGPTFRMLDRRLRELVRYADVELATGRLDPDIEFHLAALLLARLRGDAVRPETPIARALSVMAASYGTSLSIAALAQTAGLGLSQFHAAFRRETGKTPGEVLRDVRLDKARALLQGTKLSIAEIALAVGFSDQTAFTRCLRRFRATTPDALRRTRTAV